MSETAVRTPPLQSGTEWLQPQPPATRFVLHGGAAVRTAAAAVWQAPFTSQACRAMVHGRRATLWMGPEEYLLLTPDVDESGTLFADLERALSGTPHALVDVSHRQTAIEISGPHAAAILNGGCPLDLDEGAFPVGMCTRTVFTKADIVLWRTAADSFHVEVWRSFSDYLVALLSEVARDYYPAPAPSRNAAGRTSAGH